MGYGFQMDHRGKGTLLGSGVSTIQEQWKHYLNVTSGNVTHTLTPKNNPNFGSSFYHWLTSLLRYIYCLELIDSASPEEHPCYGNMILLARSCDQFWNMYNYLCSQK